MPPTIQLAILIALFAKHDKEISETLVPGQLLWDLWWTMWYCDRHICPSFPVLLFVSIIPPMLHTHLFVYHISRIIFTIENMAKIHT